MKTNILLITSDQQHWHTLGMHNPEIQTFLELTKIYPEDYMDSSFDLGSFRQNLDLNAVAQLAQKVDLAELIQIVGAMNESDLNRLLRLLRSNGKPSEAPPVNSDFYDIADVLTEEEQAVQMKVRHFMEEEVRPIINDYWLRGEFPQSILPKFAALIADVTDDEPYHFPYRRPIICGIVKMEQGRVDPSIATFFGVHWGLCMGSIRITLFCSI